MTSHDVFISHSAKDKAIADAACAKLEAAGIRCWIAPRDILPGLEWGEAIIEAINGTRVMILVLSAHANASRQIIREVERAVHRGAIVVPFRIEDVMPSRALEYYISTPHWLDALSPPIERHIDKLVETIQQLLARLRDREPQTEPVVAQPEVSTQPQSRFPLPAPLSERYLAEQELASGKAGKVYLARDLVQERMVALKVLHPRIAEALAPDRFLVEVERAAALQHPNLLAPVDWGAAEGTFYYATPHVAGETLRQHLERVERLPLDDALRIALGIAEALRHGHERGLVHRDLHPGKIVLRNGAALLLDFGIAAALEAAAAARSPQARVDVGTPAYMSPEQAAGDLEVDGRTDLYSLGCVLFEMIAGTPPFTGPTVQAIIAKRFMHPLPSLRKLAPSVPRHVEQAVAQALAQLPADRVAGAAEFISLLKQEAASIAIAPPPATIEVGDRFALTATVHSGAGLQLADAEVRWTSSDATVAAVGSADGSVTARTPGTATITATSGNLSKAVSLRVAAPQVAAIEIATPASQVLHVGEQVELAARARDRRGGQLDRPLRWTSSDPAIARVSAEGVVTATGPGPVTIAAEADGVRAGTFLLIEEEPVAALRLSPPPPAVHVGETFTLTATPLSASDRPLEDRQVSWMSSDPAVASISSDGRVTAHAPGSAVLIADSGGKKAMASVTIAAPAAPEVERPAQRGPADAGRAIRVGAIAPGGAGVETPRELPSTEEVDRTHELGATPGTDRHQARTHRGQPDGMDDLAAARRGDAPRGTGMTREPPTLPVGDSTEEGGSSPAGHAAPPLAARGQVEHLQDFTLTREIGSDADEERTREIGRTVPGRAGRAIPGGTEELHPRPAAARTAGESDHTLAIDAPTPLSRPPSSQPAQPARRVPPWVLGVAASLPVLFLVWFLFARQAPVTEPVSTLVPDTMVTAANGGEPAADPAAGPGTADPAGDPQTATGGGGSGTTPPIRPPGGQTTPPAGTPPAPPAQPGGTAATGPASGAVASVAIATPTGQGLRAGESVRLQATLRNAGGETVTGEQVTWSSSAPGVARVDQRTGVVQAVAPGTATITARAGSQTATVRLEVGRPAAASVALAPAGRALNVGETHRLSATVVDAQGGRIQNPQATWRSDNPAVASVDRNGTVTARAPGAATVTATVEGMTARTRVEVAPQQVARRDPPAQQQQATPPAPPPPPPPPPPPAADPAADASAARREAEAAVRGGVERCLDAVMSRDANRVRSVYNPVTGQDRSNLEELSRRMQSPGFSFTAQQRRGEEIGTREATGDFQVTYRYRTNFGANRTERATFRAHFEREGSGWTMRGCRIVGSL